MATPIGVITHTTERADARHLWTVSYDAQVTTPLERPKTPALVVLVGSAIAVLIGFILLKMVIGFVITIAKLVIVVAVIVAVAMTVGRAFGDD